MCKRASCVLALALGVALQLVLTAGFARADTVTLTSDFSMAYGAAQDALGGASVWNDSENAGTNSPTAQGDFQFVPVPAGKQFSTAGATFPGRTLKDGYDYSGQCFTDGGYTFNVPITASYTGAAPGATGTPDYKLRLEITNISVYAGVYNATGGTSVAWDEITSGHTGSSSTITLTPHTDWTKAANYSLLGWNPDDYDVSVTGKNDTFTRTFGIKSIGADDMRYLDGLIVEGRVVMTYNGTVPEPSAVVLLITAGMGLLAYAWRKRK
jgi:hypothetical protein